MADRVEEVILEKFAALPGDPGIGHRRSDLTSADVRFFPVYSYLIVYRPTTKPLPIVAVLHGARDVLALLKKRV
jgi:antitoxin ParD1/3/4/toxin ParE1/3/4